MFRSSSIYCYEKLVYDNLLATQESSFCRFGTSEVERVDRFSHEFRDAVVTQITDAAFVGMMDMLVGGEFPGFDFQSHLFIGISERCTCLYSPVYFFHAEHIIISFVVENMLIDGNLRNHEVDHVQALFQFVERG